MNYIFPYQKVPKNSKIILYGCGNVGKEYYLQIIKTGYCEIVGWCDRKIMQYKDHAKIFITSEEIGLLQYDYVVIAVKDKELVREIQETLIICGVESEKIIYWVEELSVTKFPENDVVLIEKGELVLNILRKINEVKQQFGEGEFYQSFPKLGLKGQRPTQERIELYGLRNILTKEQSVLDIGSNCGFFDMQIAEYVKKIFGIEVNDTLVEIANMTSCNLQLNNCSFENLKFEAWNPTEKYDVIFAFSVIKWIEMTAEDFANKVYQLLYSEGYLVIESHNVESAEEVRIKYKKCIEILLKHNMSLVNQGTLCDDGRIKREFVILKKCEA